MVQRKIVHKAADTSDIIGDGAVWVYIIHNSRMSYLNLLLYPNWAIYKEEHLLMLPDLVSCFHKLQWTIPTHSCTRLVLITGPLPVGAKAEPFERSFQGTIIHNPQEAFQLLRGRHPGAWPLHLFLASRSLIEVTWQGISAFCLPVTCSLQLTF